MHMCTVHAVYVYVCPVCCGRMLLHIWMIASKQAVFALHSCCRLYTEHFVLGR